MLRTRLITTDFSLSCGNCASAIPVRGEDRLGDCTASFEGAQDVVSLPNYGGAEGCGEVRYEQSAIRDDGFRTYSRTPMLISAILAAFFLNPEKISSTCPIQFGKIHWRKSCVGQIEHNGR